MAHEKTLNDMKIDERRAWARDIMDNLMELVMKGDEIVFLAGIKYIEFLVEPLNEYGYPVQLPLEGLRFGEQKSWLKRRLEELNA